MHWLQSREIVLAIIDFQQAADQVRLNELERARRLLARGESPEVVLEQLAHGLTQKYMHGPLAALNRSESDDRQQLLALRSEEHTSELQSIMRISYAVFCLKKKKMKIRSYK